MTIETRLLVSSWTFHAFIFYSDGVLQVLLGLCLEIDIMFDSVPGHFICGSRRLACNLDNL